MGSTPGAALDQAPKTEEVSDKIFTIPNVISFARLCLVPVFFVLLIEGHNGWAVATFAFAACTDFVDGQIARRTNSVSRLGQLLDPLVDRVLIVSGVLGVYLVGRLPLWIILIVVVRDCLMVFGSAVLLFKYQERIPVVYAGKFATTFLFLGFAGLLLNWPLVSGLGVTTLAWLPGFTAASVSWGIWFIYAGMILSVTTGVYYTVKAVQIVRRKKQEARFGSAPGSLAEIEA